MPKSLIPANLIFHKFLLQKGITKRKVLRKKNGSNPDYITILNRSGKCHTRVQLRGGSPEQLAAPGWSGGPLPSGCCMNTAFPLPRIQCVQSSRVLALPSALSSWHPWRKDLLCTLSCTALILQTPRFGLLGKLYRSDFVF
jgi:hypothetical protein